MDTSPPTEAESDDRLRELIANCGANSASERHKRDVRFALLELQQRRAPEPAPAAVPIIEKVKHLIKTARGAPWLQLDEKEWPVVLAALQCFSGEPRDERIDWMWRWIDRITCGQCSVQEGLSVLTYSPDAPSWVQKMKSSDPLPPVRSSTTKPEPYVRAGICDCDKCRQTKGLPLNGRDSA